jgi:hypothetical protein
MAATQTAVRGARPTTPRGPRRLVSAVSLGGSAVLVVLPLVLAWVLRGLPWM